MDEWLIAAKGKGQKWRWQGQEWAKIMGKNRRRERGSYC